MQPTNFSMFEPILRASLTFFIVLIIARILGRKQISQLTFFDYIAGTAIGSLSASGMANNSIPLVTYILCFITWTILIMSLNTISQHYVPARKLIAEEPIVVIRSGKILEQNLGSSQYTVNHLLMQLREKAVFDPSQIDIGILEANGELSILKKAEYQNITAKDLNISCHYKNTGALKCTGLELVMNGKILEQNLSALNISKKWLEGQLRKQGISDIHNVTVAAMTPSGKLYIDMEFDLSDIV
ncbi:MAG: DUF421 domain-containing protein [Pelosinus sp.]|nr:DUF421 domain-containing protein [Pelosinus sp.]